MGAMAITSTEVYVGWEELVVSNEPGLRQVRYHLKRSDGGTDLVVVGKEKSNKHISYHFVKDKQMLLSKIDRLPMPKLRSHKDVIDCLNSIISGQNPASSLPQFRWEILNELDANLIKKIGTDRNEFMWLGSSWTCRKRRSHYQAFCRKGIKISVHDFVYVLAEEDKRLVAYLDDMYIDSRGNKMAVVQWFHRIDEVGFALPHIYNDREIFFSLCLQDLSIECIDGLATILSPEHYEKFAEEMGSGSMLFVCCRLFDNDCVKPFDMTTVKGYWKQSILRDLSSLEDEPFDAVKVDTVGQRPNKRIRWSREFKKDLTHLDDNISAETNSKIQPLQKCTNRFTIGSQVEILSQDSGIRGCWFRALIIKKYKESVKLQYLDVKDPDDGSKNLEDWILASRIAAIDVLGIRFTGRPIIRPIHPGHVRCSSRFSVGSSVDAWWCDGWWEGIVLKKEYEDKLHVYFPGEKKEHTFRPSELRHSQEWLEDAWHAIKENPEVLNKVSSPKLDTNAMTTDDSVDKVVDFTSSFYEKARKNKGESIRDLTKDGLLAQLRWTMKRLRSPPSSLHPENWKPSSHLTTSLIV